MTDGDFVELHVMGELAPRRLSTDVQLIEQAQAALDATTRENERRIAEAQATWNRKHEGLRAVEAMRGMIIIMGGSAEAITQADINVAKDAYVRGEIEIDEFERRLDAILL